ncbi:MAG: dihydroorotate dehydrogenase [Firmicutes bacterium]|nr:dihydroorotate dehydrogenase [Bacillota bacterium]
MKPELKVDFAGVPLKNPLVTASGTYNPEASGQFYDPSILGAVTLKGVSAEAWQGNPTPRIAETYGGMLNSVGLQNPGAAEYLAHEIPYMEQFDTKVIINLAGHSIEEYERVTEMLCGADRIDMFELNISCPNVKEGGMTFGTDARMAEQVVKAVKRIADKPLIVKLSPNVTDITEIARAAVAGGADALSLINTLLGMRIDIRRRQPILARSVGGFSGPAVKPVAVRMVWQVSHAVDVPVLGMGGVSTGEDVVEMIMAGATAVALGTVCLTDPQAPVRILGELEETLNRLGIRDVNEIRGCV